MTPIGITAGIFAASHLVARIGDQGLAHTVGLATLRHGTNPLSWISIHLIGFLPSMGGSLSGGDAIMRENERNKNNVYLASDSEEHRYDGIGAFVFNRVLMRFIPKFFCATSCMALGVRLGLPKTPFHYTHPIAKIASTFIHLPILTTSLLIPTIKVRMDPLEAKNLSKDHDLPAGSAVYTNKAISPLHIGMIGTLWNGLTFKTFHRIYHNPLRCITGLALIAMSVSAVYAGVTLIPSILIAHKISIIAGVILAIV